MRRVPGRHSVLARFDVVDRVLLHLPGLRGAVNRLLVSVGHYERHVWHILNVLRKRAYRQPVVVRHLPRIHDVRHLRWWPGLLVQRLVRLLHCVIGRVLGAHDRRGGGLRGLRLPRQYVQFHRGVNRLIVHGVSGGVGGARRLHVLDFVRRVDVLRWLVLERGPMFHLRCQLVLGRRRRNGVHGVLDHRRGLHDLGRNRLDLQRCLLGACNHRLRPGTIPRGRCVLHVPR